MGFIGKLLMNRKNVHGVPKIESQGSIYPSASKSTESIQMETLSRDSSPTLSIEELDMVENKKRYPSRSKTRVLMWHPEPVRVVPTPPPTISVERYLRRRIMGPLKNVVESMITEEECYGIPVEKCLVPKVPHITRRNFSQKQDIPFSILKSINKYASSPKTKCNQTAVSSRNCIDLSHNVEMIGDADNKFKESRSDSPGLPSSRSPSWIDFDNLEADSLPFAKEHKTFPKIFGFDRFGREIEEDTLPDISYAFGNSQNKTHNKYELERYVEYIRKIDVCEEKSVFNQQHLPDNHELIPSYQRETVETYMENVCEIKRRNWEDTKEKNQNSNGKPRIDRIRRKTEEGSYRNSSVEEEDLHPLLRFTWKGKLNKLKKYLKDLDKQGKHYKVNGYDKQGRTALHFAASWGCDRTVKELLSVPEINLNVTDEQGKTPLYKAVEIGDLKTVQLLVEAGANVRVQALDERNVFEYALQELGDDYFSIINYLYTEGEMYKERKDEAKISYLHLLVLSRKSIRVSAVMEDLIKRGEFVNATEGKGRTPLILACKMGKDDLARILIEYGADLKHIDMYLKSAIQYCKDKSDCYKYVRSALDRLPKKKQRKLRKKRDTKESVEQRDVVMIKSLHV